MTIEQIIIAVAIVLYLIMMLAIGVFYSKKNSTIGDFYLGGRTLGPYVTAMSAEASDMSSWLLMGLPGVAYLTGVADAGWTAIGLAVGTYINWLVVAKRLRVYSQKVNAITVPDFFSKRYHDKKNVLNLIAASVIIVFFIPYTASGFAACGKLFSTIFGIDYLTAMLISAVIIIGYTTLGGFLAASMTDFIQSIVMVLALTLVLSFGIFNAGGIDAVMDNARSMDGYLSFFSSHDSSTNSATDYGFITIVSTLAWGLGYLCMPHILLRFMAIEQKEKLGTARRVATTWVVISLFIAIFIGIVGNALTDTGFLISLKDSGSETVIIKLADIISSYGIFPALLAGIILAGILAATMSTADSQLLAASSSVSKNVLCDFLKFNLSEKKAMLVARCSVFVISIIAIIIARNPNSSVFEIVSFAWAGFGATFGPVVLAALFWKKSNKYGAFGAMLIGSIMIFVWKYLVRPLGGIWDIYELLPAFLLSLAALVILSLVFKDSNQDMIKEYNQYEMESK